MERYTALSRFPRWSIPDMEIGVNLGVPNTRNAFRQRIGRAGRKSPGLFVVSYAGIWVTP